MRIRRFIPEEPKEEDLNDFSYINALLDLAIALQKKPRPTRRA